MPFDTPHFHFARLDIAIIDIAASPLPALLYLLNCLIFSTPLAAMPGCLLPDAIRFHFHISIAFELSIDSCADVSFSSILLIFATDYFH